MRARRCGHAECLASVSRASDRLREERAFIAQIEPRVTLATSAGPVTLPRRLVEAHIALDDATMCKLRNHDPGDEDRSER